MVVGQVEWDAGAAARITDVRRGDHGGHGEITIGHRSIYVRAIDQQILMIARIGATGCIRTVVREVKWQEYAVYLAVIVEYCRRDPSVIRREHDAGQQASIDSKL